VDVARLQPLLAGEEVGRLDEHGLVRHPHERDLPLLVGEDESPGPSDDDEGGARPGRMSFTQKVRLPL